MILASIKALRDLDKVQLHAGLDSEAIDQFESTHRLKLPREHKEVLRCSNGLELYSGYYRLFGLGTSAGIDLLSWNQPEYWKFAWRSRCSSYWCFAETAWGDQYAYLVEALRSGRDAEVYFLDAVSMTPEVIAGSFGEFLETELLRSARDPYDQMIRLARAKFGPLDTALHLVYMPSLLLGGAEVIESVRTMNARAAMICNGDLATQLDEGPRDGLVKSVQSYEDAYGRLRLRVSWG
jgi:hypothetical protein